MVALIWLGRLPLTPLHERGHLKGSVRLTVEVVESERCFEILGACVESNQLEEITQALAEEM